MIDRSGGNWVRACDIADIPVPSGFRLDHDPPIAVFKVGDEVFAIDDRCTHGEFSLAEGDVDEEGLVECLGHMAQFCVRTGKARTLPATIAVATHPVDLRDGVVYVRIKS